MMGAELGSVEKFAHQASQAMESLSRRHARELVILRSEMGHELTQVTRWEQTAQQVLLAEMPASDMAAHELMDMRAQLAEVLAKIGSASDRHRIGIGLGSDRHQIGIGIGSRPGCDRDRVGRANWP